MAAIQVKYEPLPAVMSLEEALAPGAPLVHPENFPTNVGKKVQIEDWRCGEALSFADLIVEDRV